MTISSFSLTANKFEFAKQTPIKYYMNLQISSTEKRKGASLVRMMRPGLFLGTRERFLSCPASPRMERGAITRLGAPLSETHPVVLLERAD